MVVQCFNWLPANANDGDAAPLCVCSDCVETTQEGRASFGPLALRRIDL